MRSFILISLLATTAVALPAQAQDRGDRRGPRAERSDDSSSEGRSSRRSDRSSDDDSSAAKPERERPVMRERPQEVGQEPVVVERRGRGNANVAPVAPAAGDSVRNWRGRDRRPVSPTHVQDRNLGVAPTDNVTTDRRPIDDRNVRRVGGGDGAFDRNVRTTPGYGGRVGRIGRNVPVEGTAPPPVTSEQARRGNDNHRRWTHDWRSDRRYDWRRYRDRNRSRFHLGFYFDPFGWNYRRYSIGWRLWPSYYGQDYWLNDPWQYRLPPAYGPYRWVRYHDDALLVNIYTGTVVDVIYNFFW